MRGVPLVTPALVRMFLLDQYDDAELERKRIAAMFAGFVTTATPEDVIPIDGVDASAPQENIGLSGLEPGTMQTLLPGEDIKFSEPADVGGSYEAYQYRQQLALFAALGIPYTLATSDSAARELLVAARLHRRVPAASSSSSSTTSSSFRCARRSGGGGSTRRCWPRRSTSRRASTSRIRPTYQRAKWIPQRNDWVDPLKDRQAEKLAVDAGFKRRSDVIEAEGYDPEENDRRIKADKDREEKLDLVFPVVYAAASQPLSPSDQAAADQDAHGRRPRQAAQDAPISNDDAA